MIRKLLIGSFLALLSAIQLCSASANDATTSVRWNPTIYPDEALKATKVEDFRPLLASVWTEKISVFVKKDKPAGEVKMQLQSCEQLFEVEETINRTVDPTDWQSMVTSLLRCKAMRIMAQMRPSKMSYVNVDVLTLVPAFAAIQLDSRHDDVREFFSGLGKKASETKCFRKDYCRVTTKDDVYMLSVVGAGDFNADGVEDNILIISASPARGTATSGLSLGFVMTREAYDKPLKILARFERER